MAKDNYQISAGSTIITFVNDYLDTLSVGKHTVKVYFDDGSATTSLTIKEKQTTTTPSNTNDSTNIGTGDTTNLTGLFSLLMLATACGFVVLKKKAE